MACDTCGEPSQTIAQRPNGEACCDACWRSALAHGHTHGLHDDGSADPTDPVLDDCPHCPPMPERVRRAALRDIE